MYWKKMSDAAEPMRYSHAPAGSTCGGSAGKQYGQAVNKSLGMRLCCTGAEGPAPRQPAELTAVGVSCAEH